MSEGLECTEVLNAEWRREGAALIPAGNLLTSPYILGSGRSHIYPSGGDCLCSLGSGEHVRMRCSGERTGSQQWDVFAVYLFVGQQVARDL